MPPSQPVCESHEKVSFGEELLAELRRDGFSAEGFRRFITSAYVRARDDLYANPHLARSILGWGLAFFAAQFVYCAGLSLTLDHRLAVECLAAGSVWLVFSCVWMLAHAGLAFTSTGERLERVTLPNLLTLLRSLLIPLIVVSAVSGHLVLAAVLFAIGGITDILDGVAARGLGQVTKMGTIMDHLVDVLFTAAMFLSLVWAGVLSPWIGVLVGLRYGLMLIGGALVCLLRGPVKIKPTTFGKLSGTILYLMVLLQIGVEVYGAPRQVLKISELLHVGFTALLSMTVLQVLVIGWYNLKRKERVEGLPKVVGDVRWP